MTLDLVLKPRRPLLALRIASVDHAPSPILLDLGAAVGPAREAGVRKSIVDAPAGVSGILLRRVTWPAARPSLPSRAGARRADRALRHGAAAPRHSSSRAVLTGVAATLALL